MRLVVAVAFGYFAGHFVELLGELAVGLVEDCRVDLDGDIVLLQLEL